MMKALLLATSLIACGSDSSEFTSLYDAPQGGSTDTLFGTWGGRVSGSDLRWVIASDRITIANKCGSTIVGIDVAAANSTAQLRILESADAGDDTCFVRASPGTFNACPSDPFEPRDSCFELAAKQLSLFAQDLEVLSLTKLTDATP